MSDTVKLIIEISKEDFEWIQTHKNITDYQITQMLYKRVMNGTPLDDVKAEIAEQFETEFLEESTIGMNFGLRLALEIIDNIGKVESEDKCNSCKYYHSSICGNCKKI